MRRLQRLHVALATCAIGLLLFALAAPTSAQVVGTPGFPTDGFVQPGFHEAAALTPLFGNGLLTVVGAGFQPGERVQVVVRLDDFQVAYAAMADAFGRFRLPTGLAVPPGSAVELLARGHLGTARAAIATAPPRLAPRGPAPPLAPPPRPRIPVVTADQVLDESLDYFGRLVTVIGRVDDCLERIPGAWTLEDDDFFFQDELLVVRPHPTLAVRFLEPFGLELALLGGPGELGLFGPCGGWLGGVQDFDEVVGQEGALDEAELVAVTGVVRYVNPDTVERELGTFMENALFSEFQSQPFVIAVRVEAVGPEAAELGR